MKTIVAERVSKIREAVDFIRAHRRERPGLGLILGSGLGAYPDTWADRVVIPFSDIPNFPAANVAGHSGNLVIGNAEEIPAIALQGRAHFYEGFSISEIALPVQALGCLGIRYLFVTNAAGAINRAYKPGDFMLISDHINFTGTNPLIGPNIEEFGPRFPDMSEAYDLDLRKIARKAARQKKITLREGVYLGLSGPSYETPAEIRMFRTLGADAVGMSTVPEVIVARHMGLRVLGISCITDMAAGILPQPQTHKEVLDTAAKAQTKFVALLQSIVRNLRA
jgi:purine-nucleoside phosphorylase